MTAWRADLQLCTYLYNMKGKEPLFTPAQREVKVKVTMMLSWIPVLFSLSTFSLLNFSFCLLASVLMGVITLIFRPTRRSRQRDIVNAVALIVLSLPIIQELLQHYFEVDALALSISLYQTYGSLIFPFLTLVYFPYTLSLFSLALWGL